MPKFRRQLTYLLEPDNSNAVAVGRPSSLIEGITRGPAQTLIDSPETWYKASKKKKNKVVLPTAPKGGQEVGL
jgi:hypothetical protein